MTNSQPRSRSPRRASRQAAKLTLLQVHRQVAKTSLKRMIKTPVASFMTLFVFAVSLLLPALLFSLNNNLLTVLGDFQNSARITLFLQETVNETEGLEISNNLLTDNAINSVEYTSKSQALIQFGDASGLTEVLRQMDSNPLPAALVVTPADPAPAAVDALAQRLQQLQQVDLVQVDSQWLLRLQALTDLVLTIGQALALLVVLGLFFIVGNTIRLAIENRKDEIRVIKLVGGTDGFVARPFLYTGLFYGLGGGILACVLQLLVLRGFNSSLQTLIRLYESSFELQGFAVLDSVLLILAGAAIGWFGALVASFRHIRVISP